MPFPSSDSHPFGASWDGQGVFFKVFSSSATSLELCLFASEDGPETARIPLVREDGGIFTTYRPDIAPGQLYGYRADGPFAPERGQRFDPRNLLIDPYAKAITGDLRWDRALLDEAEPEPHERLKARDTAPFMPKGVVIDPAFDWDEDRRLETPWDETLIYEVHVKGMTRRHPAVPPELRGTFLGLAHDAVIEHLLDLGVTAVELLPIQHFVTEKHLVQKGLGNYWGYSPLGFFAPHAGYATAGHGQQVYELKTLVKTLHRTGIEVLVDVVFNHTAEGDHRGVTLSWRGLDNAAYYLLDPDDPARNVDLTGCGNTLGISHPRTLELVLDALRYWVEEMHVDGFRFDLAPALGREGGSFSSTAPFFARIADDPVLSRIKLIAEPWDLGPDGYRLGGFPAGWTEWNDRYRDTLRSFWRGDSGHVAELATRLAGSRDLFSQRTPQASLNFVACHDGFTLRDLVSYEHKHNAANGEANRDGHEPNLSANWGIEGDTSEPRILAQRQRLERAFLSSLALSWGVPMLGHGDELGRSQRGNNNAYCHDNELTWIDWRLTEQQRDLLAFTRRLFAWRRRHAGWWMGGFPDEGTLTWLAPEGIAMTPELWQEDERRVLGLWIHPQSDPRETLLILLNADSRPFHFALPENCRKIFWRLCFDTAELADLFDAAPVLASPPFDLAPHSLKLLTGHES